MIRRISNGWIGLFCLAACLCEYTQAADHADTPQLVIAGRHDARIADFHAFMRGNNLVIAVSMNPNIPVQVMPYVFATDSFLKNSIDLDSGLPERAREHIDAGEVYTLGALARIYEEAEENLDAALELAERNLKYTRDSASWATAESIRRKIRDRTKREGAP